MSQNRIQASFAGGELTPDLYARVDIQKYHSAAALMRNMFADYLGGASSRMGTKYILQARQSAKKVRLIPFQASFNVGYVLEFGDFYIRFFQNGAPVLEAAINISSIATGATTTFTLAADSYANGDWVLFEGTNIPALDGNYFFITSQTGGGPTTFTIADLFGNAVVSSGTYSGTGVTQRVYTLGSPYAAADLALVKFAQNVNTMYLVHPNYLPQVLTLITATNWTINQINFGPTIPAPSAGLAITSNLGVGTTNYGYAITSVDANGQESGPSTLQTIGTLKYIGTNAGYIKVTWTAVPGAASYNVYKASPVDSNTVDSGAPLGFVANVGNGSVIFYDSNPGLGPDFAQTPPIIQAAFFGGEVTKINVTGNGSYTTVPEATIPAAPSGGINATCYAVLGALTISSVGNAGTLYNVGDTIVLPNGVVLQVLTLTGHGVATAAIISQGSVTGVGNAVPSNPVAQVSSSGSGSGATFNLTWGVVACVVLVPGAGYTGNQSVAFSAGAAAATAVVSPTSGGGSLANPSVVSLFQERLVLGAPNNALQSFFMSQPGTPFNFDISNPIQPDDSITATIASSQLNQIKSFTQVPTGLIALTNKAAWLINGGGSNIGITPSNVGAVSQAFNGANDLPPIQINYNFLYGQAKGPYIRDASFNFYANIYTGTDISVMSNHLFKGFTINEWAWAEEPHKVAWAVRNDGVLLSLTYMKEQEITGWAHHDTYGLFESVCTVVEQGIAYPIDALYVVVRRYVNGEYVRYIERMAERLFPYGVEDAWCVDAGLESASTAPAANLTVLATSGSAVTANADAAVFSSANTGQYIRVGGGIGIMTYVSTTQITINFSQPITALIGLGPTGPWLAPSGTWTTWAPFTTFSGLNHLNGMQVSVNADGVFQGLFTVSGGSITLTKAASKVIVGLPFFPQLQTLKLDVGEPTVQGKRKKVAALVVRCRETLGISAGKTFNTLVPMKDFVVGNLNLMTNQVVANLVSDDGRVVMDPAWTTDGQICIQQNFPWPVTVLGVIPEIVVGDS